MRTLGLMILLFGYSGSSHGANTFLKFNGNYKVERCTEVGFLSQVTEIRITGDATSSTWTAVYLNGEIRKYAQFHDYSSSWDGRFADYGYPEWTWYRSGGRNQHFWSMEKRFSLYSLNENQIEAFRIHAKKNGSSSNSSAVRCVLTRI